MFERRVLCVRTSAYLVFIDLKQDGVQDQAGPGGHVEGLLRLGEPVDEVLEGVVELHGHSESLFQFNLQRRTSEHSVGFKVLPPASVATLTDLLSIHAIFLHLSQTVFEY